MNHKTVEINDNHFLCMDCGREVIVTSWVPLRRTIIKKGNDTVQHSFGRGVTLSAEACEKNLFSDFVNLILGGDE